MADISKERHCKQAHEEWRECLADVWDKQRFENKDKSLATKMYETTRGKACVEFRERLHECSRNAMFDEDLYFEAK